MFSGIGGFELGIKKATSEIESRDSSNRKSESPQYCECSFHCVGFSEIDKHAIKCYSTHFPEHKNFGDATKIIPRELPEFDFLCGGFPCQAFSIAGKRLGFQDTRGTLFFDIARIIKERRPQMFLLENVKGLLSHDNGRTIAVILATIDELGYNAEWEVLNSKYFLSEKAVTQILTRVEKNKKEGRGFQPSIVDMDNGGVRRPISRR